MTYANGREYSQRLGFILNVQLQAALNRFDLGTLITADPAPGGLFGQNVMISATSGEYVLRGVPHYDWQWAKERHVAKLVQERTAVPVPWPYSIDPTPDVFGWSYAVMPRLPGLNIADRELRKSFSPRDREQQAEAMGAMLAELHALTFDAPGVYDAASDRFVPLPRPYDEWFVNNTRTWLERSRHASKATTDADVAWVESVIASAAESLRVPFTPVLVHDDYTETNVAMSEDGGRWRITGVFDLMTAQAGDGEADLARSLCAYTFEDARLGELFLSAYTARRPLREGWRERMRLYVLTDRLVFWEYGQRNKRWFDPGTHLREWAEQFVEMEICA